jgi:acyl-CoA synthetase (AMP-forming)/AMP-acid ligase II
MNPYLLQHLLENKAGEVPSKTAVKNKDEEISYIDLYTKSRALGYILKSFEISRWSRIGILLDKSVFQVVSLIGVLYADCVFVILNNALHEKQIRHILNDCNINIIITAEKYRTLLEGLVGETEVKEILFEEALTLNIEQCAGQKLSNINIADDMSNIIYTSGSTGMPKGIVITHRNLIDGAQIVSQYLKITKDDRILGLLPFNFDYGLNQLNCTLLNGSTIFLFQYFMPNALLKILQDEKITGLAAMPPIWASVFNPKLSKLDEKNDFSNLRYITNSGGKLPVAVVKKIRDFFKNTDLYLMYGLTEAFRSTFLPPEEVDAHPDSIGRAIPNVQVEVINEDGMICNPG